MTESNDGSSTRKTSHKASAGDWLKLRELLGFPEEKGPQAKAPVLDQRVRIILEELAAGRWDYGRSEVEYAEKWGVSIVAVQQARQRATQYLRIMLGEEEEIKARVLLRIEEGLKLARDAKGHFPGEDGVIEYAKPDLREFREFLRFEVEMLDLKPKERPPEAGEFVDITEDELRSVMNRAGYEIVRKQPEVGESERADDATDDAERPDGSESEQAQNAWQRRAAAVRPKRRRKPPGSTGGGRSTPEAET